MVDSSMTPGQFIDAFEAQLGAVDEIAQIVLNAHLIVERALDQVIAAIFPFGQHLKGTRLNFFQRVHIARAFGLGENETTEWDLVLAMNAIRNMMAHRQVGDKREDRIADLRRILLKMGNDMFKKDVSNATEKGVITYAAAMAGGFLNTLEVRAKVMVARVGFEGQSVLCCCS
jgi:hypothetical protein